MCPFVSHNLSAHSNFYVLDTLCYWLIMIYVLSNFAINLSCRLRLQRMSSRSLGVLWSSLTYCNHLINLFGGEASRVLYWLWLGKTKEGHGNSVSKQCDGRVLAEALKGRWQVQAAKQMVFPWPCLFRTGWSWGQADKQQEPRCFLYLYLYYIYTPKKLS